MDGAVHNTLTSAWAIATYLVSNTLFVLNKQSTSRSYTPIVALPGRIAPVGVRMCAGHLVEHASQRVAASSRIVSKINHVCF